MSSQVCHHSTRMNGKIANLLGASKLYPTFCFTPSSTDGQQTTQPLPTSWPPCCLPYDCSGWWRLLLCFVKLSHKLVRAIILVCLGFCRGFVPTFSVLVEKKPLSAFSEQKREHLFCWREKAKKSQEKAEVEGTAICGCCSATAHAWQ